MDTNYYKKYEPIFGSWYIKRLIGEGGFGQVYEIERNELGTTYKAALKTITIPQSKSEVNSIKADGMSDADVTSYYEGVVQDIISEFILMSQMKGNSNIVSYEDHQIIKHEDGIGWDILIRMELLTPLFDYLQENDCTAADVAKMGIDLCKSLELCRKHNIVHRDIKPENIFISPNGDYKLGDFGIARTIEKTASGLSRKGTFLYMAPEIYLGKAYGQTVDIYSLGLVMYRLLNDNRMPFFPEYPKPITHTDRENSVVERMRGTDLPVPSKAPERLAEIVLKSCAFDPEKRYTTAVEMRKDLETFLNGQTVEADRDNVVVPVFADEFAKAIQEEHDVETVAAEEMAQENTVLLETESVADEIENTDVSTDITEEPLHEITCNDVHEEVENVTDTEQAEDKQKSKKIFIIIAAIVILIAGLAVVFSSSSGRTEKDSDVPASETQMETEKNSEKKKAESESENIQDSDKPAYSKDTNKTSGNNSGKSSNTSTKAPTKSNTSTKTPTKSNTSTKSPTKDKTEIVIETQPATKNDTDTVITPSEAPTDETTEIILETEPVTEEDTVVDFEEPEEEVAW